MLVSRFYDSGFCRDKDYAWDEGQRFGLGFYMGLGSPVRVGVMLQVLAG